MSSLVDSPEYQTAARFLELTIEYREHKERMKELEETMDAIEPALLAHLAAANIKKITIGNYTLSPRRQPWIYPITGISRERVCEALKIAGLGRMVKENYNTQTLTTYIQQLEERAQLIVGLEADADGNPTPLTQLPGLHPALAEILHVKPAYSLQVRKNEKDHAKSTEERSQNEGDQTDDF